MQTSQPGHQFVEKVKFKKRKKKENEINDQTGHHYQCNMAIAASLSYFEADHQEAINTHRINGPVWQALFPAIVLQVNNSTPLTSQIVP